jgi:lambda family phage tail tape measure protein
MSDLFSNFLQTGKFAFKDFAKAILQTISQIVAKIIATGIIKLIANILVPGSGAVVGGVGAASGGGGFLKSLGGLLGIGGVAAPSFAGVGAGQLGMSGSVNMVLRGSDLVGSINRTNSTINRVG